MMKVDIDHVLTARKHIDPVFLDPPVTGHPALDAALGCTILAKVETLNPIRSFKGRGTEFFTATEVHPGDHLVCASAGNFGQGLARAALRRGYACTAFAAETANPMKVEALRRLGAEVRLAGHDFDAAKIAARRHAEETGMRFVEDGAEPAIAAGAGTIGLEIAQAIPDLEALAVPLGNGALLAGVGAAMRHAAPDVEIIAVVAASAPAMKLSLETGDVIETEYAITIADGIAVRVPIPAALNMLAGCYDAIVAVTEDEIRHAMRLVHTHLGLVVEPAGAVGIAAILAAPERFKGRRIATILGGSNISQADLAALSAPASASGEVAR